ADGACALDAVGLEGLSRGFSRRVLRNAIRRAGSTMEDLSFERVEQVRRLLREGMSGKSIQLPGGMEVGRSFGSLIFRRRRPSMAYEHRLTIPGRVEIPQAGVVIEARIMDSRAPDTAPACATRARADSESLGPYVKIRNWKNGDVYHPIGRAAL